MFLPVTSAQPAGTVKLAPALVARGVSEVSCSGADLTSAAGADVCTVVAVTQVTIRPRRANRIVRCLDIGTLQSFSKFAVISLLSPQKVKHCEKLRRFLCMERGDINELTRVQHRQLPPCESVVSSFLCHCPKILRTGCTPTALAPSARPAS